jgi:hypothetical protein
LRFRQIAIETGINCLRNVYATGKAARFPHVAALPCFSTVKFCRTFGGLSETCAGERRSICHNIVMTQRLNGGDKALFSL